MELELVTIDELFDELTRRCVLRGVPGAGACVLLMQTDTKNSDGDEDLVTYFSGTTLPIVGMLEVARERVMDDEDDIGQ